MKSCGQKIKRNLQLAILTTESKFLAEIIYIEQLVHSKTSDCKTALQHALGE